MAKLAIANKVNSITSFQNVAEDALFVRTRRTVPPFVSELELAFLYSSAGSVRHRSDRARVFHTHFDLLGDETRDSAAHGLSFR